MRNAHLLRVGIDVIGAPVGGALRLRCALEELIVDVLGQFHLRDIHLRFRRDHK